MSNGIASIIIQIALGLLINIFIGPLGKLIFKSDKGASKIILRVIGIALLINGALTAGHHFNFLQ